MRAAWAIGVVIGIVGCHRAPEVQPWPERDLGDYSYRIAATPVYGKITIGVDAVTLDAQQQSCRRVGTVANPDVVQHFRCTSGSTTLNVAVNSWRPRLSTWSTVAKVTKRVEVCTQYETTKTGQRVCKSSRTEERTETVRTSGLLEVTRIDAAERP